MTAISYLLARIRLYFARRRIWRAVKAQAERREMLDPYYGQNADINLYQFWRKRK